nr:hypothetical protein BaRGS_004317 [Batillaria attramentaria]
MADTNIQGCVFEWGGVTLPLYRTTLNFNVNWATAKASFGDDLATNPASEDYFIGLDNLHHLLRQAAYQNHIFVMFDNWAGMGSSFYDNFTMGDEASSYEISYAQFFTVENPADDGLAAPGPISFTTLDHDVSGCGSARGGAGWYGTDCSGYGVFSDAFTWPVSGADKSLNSLMFNLVRQSGYYDV